MGRLLSALYGPMRHRIESIFEGVGVAWLRAFGAFGHGADRGDSGNELLIYSILYINIINIARGKYQNCRKTKRR